VVRHAESLRHWKAVPSIEHPLLPAMLDIADPLGVLPDQVNIQSLVTIFAGLNGVGKTRLLDRLSDRLGDGGRFISLHDLCGWLKRILLDRNDLADAKEEVDPLQVDQDTFEAVRSIVGRGYSDIEWYALEFDDSPFRPILGEDVVPYFRVTDGAVSYEMGEMGLGELAAHVLLWTLWYLREQSGIVVLLDEPDAYFPPRSREPLLDYVGSVAVTRNQAFVLTSHSREAIERGLTYKGTLAYMGRDGGTVRVTTDFPDVREIVRTVLYPDNPVELIGWTEDEAAHAFVLALCDRLDTTLGSRLALYWTTGMGDIEALEEHIPRPEGFVRTVEFVFFVDGDQEVREPADSKWPRVILPGRKSPDELFRDYAPEAIDSLVNAFGRSREIVISMLEKIEGRESHDWTNELADLCDLPRPMALRAMANAALDGNPTLVEEFRESLAAAGLDAVKALEA
jgi:hypothetical protein